MRDLRARKCDFKSHKLWTMFQVTFYFISAMSWSTYVDKQGGSYSSDGNCYKHIGKLVTCTVLGIFGFTSLALAAIGPNFPEFFSFLIIGNLLYLPGGVLHIWLLRDLNETYPN